MIRPQNIQNLVDIGSIQPADVSADHQRQFVADAKDYLADAGAQSASNRGRFTLSYEGLHCLAMAVLNFYGCRAGNTAGHRTIALQVFADGVGISWPALEQMHKARNKTTYNDPHPPVSKMQADTALQLLRQALPATEKLIGLSAPAASVSAAAEGIKAKLGAPDSGKPPPAKSESDPGPQD